MRLIIINILFFCGMMLHAQQDISTVLTSIEQNNNTLKAERENMEAQKLMNRTSIYLSNPEVEFNYLWGHPSTIGNMTELSFSQSFDIATLTGIKGSMANIQNKQVEWKYLESRMNILLKAKKNCLELIYHNSLMEHLNIRRSHAEVIANGYERRLQLGDANRLDYNKAQLNLASIDGEITRIKVERDELLEELSRLNGGHDISLEATYFEPMQPPIVFDDWYLSAEERSPHLAYARQEIELSKKEVALNKSMGLPVFSAGYALEQIAGERHQGVSFGVSIPLWENKNRVRQAKAMVKASKSQEIDSRHNFYSKLKILYGRVTGLKIVAENYRKSLEIANNSTLLKKALDEGEISLLEYMLEMELYYDTIMEALKAEKDYQIALAELLAVEL